MSVYVDSMMICIRNKNWPYKEACHLMADTRRELHVFAQSIGLKRTWFQNKTMPHYDLTKNRRRLAVRQGAIEIDQKQFVALLRKQRIKCVTKTT